MLIFAVPGILALVWEPKMNDGLIVNIHICFKAIREAMMCIVLVTPPFCAETYEGPSNESVQE